MTIQFNNTAEANKVMQLALGKILRIGSRPSEEGDIQLYENAKFAFLDAAEFLGVEGKADMRPDYSNDFYNIHKD